MQNLKLSSIRIDGGTQQRVEINTGIVEEYAEAMKCGAKFNPIVVMFDGAQYWLGDGFHRFHAARAAEILEIVADVRTGTQREAVLYSASANGTHGIRLTNADKRKSVALLLADNEWAQWSDHRIAKHCHVTQPFVSKMRTDRPAKTEKPITVITPEVATEPEYSEADAQDEIISVLRDEVARLNDRLAVEAKSFTTEENVLYDQTLQEVREENRSLKVALAAVTQSRDMLLLENGELKRMCITLRKKAA